MQVNVDAIFESFNRHKVDAILIGGMNFLLRHQPVLTFDVDFWVKDTTENLSRVNAALREIGAEWGADDQHWGLVPEDGSWLQNKTVVCLTSREGAVDIFRVVDGLEHYAECHARSSQRQTATGIPYRSLSDRDMLACQLALPETKRRLDRVVFLKRLLETDHE